MSLMRETSAKKQTIDYTPGLAIQGVDFRHVHAPGDVLPYLRNNGGSYNWQQDRQTR